MEPTPSSATAAAQKHLSTAGLTFGGATTVGSFCSSLTAQPTPQGGHLSLLTTPSLLAAAAANRSSTAVPPASTAATATTTPAASPRPTHRSHATFESPGDVLALLRAQDAEDAAAAAADDSAASAAVPQPILPSLEALPRAVALVREAAEAAVHADRCGEHAGAVELYAEAARRLVAVSEDAGAGLDGGCAAGTRAASLRVAQAYLQRAEELRACAERQRRERVKALRSQTEAQGWEGTGADYWDPDADAADSDSFSEGERATAKRRKLSFRSAAKMVMRLISVPFPGMRKSMAVRRLNTDAPTPIQTHCKITGRKFLSLDELSPAAATALRPLYEMGTPHVLWACFCLKRSVFHRKFAKTKMDRRTAVLSPSGFYMGAREELVRCVPVEDIKQVLISSDSWVALVIPDQYDVLFRPQENPIQTIQVMVDILTTLSKHLTGTPVLVRRLDHIDHTRLVLLKPADWQVPTFQPLKVDVRAAPESSERKDRVTLALDERTGSGAGGSFNSVGGAGGGGSPGAQQLPPAKHLSIATPTTPGTGGGGRSGGGFLRRMSTASSLGRSQANAQAAAVGSPLRSPLGTEGSPCSPSIVIDTAML